ncbi:MAG: DMT family transporter, partial [Bryobacteraceae bacterium]
MSDRFDNLGARPHPSSRAYLALACVCIVWGGTYLAIRIALESFTPEALLFLRFSVSGALTLVAAALAGMRMPRGRELWLTALYGIVVLGIGNGTLVFAEQWIASGLAALFVAAEPFWLVGIEALAGGEPLRPSVTRGMLAGAAGVIVLVAPDLEGVHANRSVLWAFLLLQVGYAAWAVGSIGQRKLNSRAHPFVSAGVQQLATGLVFLIPARIHSAPMHWTARGIAAIAYLVLFGSILGYTSYIYALDRLPVSVASIYTYVNPVVAVLLGWLAYREPFGW